MLTRLCSAYSHTDSGRTLLDGNADLYGVLMRKLNRSALLQLENSLSSNEKVLWTGSPDLSKGIWQCFWMLIRLTVIPVLIGICYLGLQKVSVNVACAISVGYVFLILVLAAVDAYTDRDVDYCLTNLRVVKFKGGRIQKELAYDRVTSLTVDESEGKGYLLFVGGPSNTTPITSISVMGIDNIAKVCAALPKELLTMSQKGAR